MSVWRVDKYDESVQFLGSNNIVPRPDEYPGVVELPLPLLPPPAAHVHVVGNISLWNIPTFGPASAVEQAEIAK